MPSPSPPPPSLETLPPALAEELTSVNAIYPSPPALTPLPSSTTTTANTTLLLTHPATPITFLLSVPATYPSDPPTVTGTHSIGTRPRGEGAAALTLLRETIPKIFVPGQVCLFDLLEEAAPLLEPGDDDDNPSSSSDNEAGNELNGQSAPRRSSSTTITDADASTKKFRSALVPPPPPAVSSSTTAAPALTKYPIDPPAYPPPTWHTLPQPLTSKKSTFLAHATRATSRLEALSHISSLLSSSSTANKKLTTATHNITAYRTRTPAPHLGHGEYIVEQDFDDDGETAAGGRVLRLLELMGAWDVVVVVSRWYGGVKLGPQRFRLINEVVRECVVERGFVEGERKGGKGEGRRK
ncbi:MAG: hypothetical protein Q9227_007936 [Pyrenula ochraceoflavens]